MNGDPRGPYGAYIDQVNLTSFRTGEEAWTNNGIEPGEYQGALVTVRLWGAGPNQRELTGYWRVSEHAFREDGSQSPMQVYLDARRADSRDNACYVYVLPEHAPTFARRRPPATLRAEPTRELMALINQHIMEGPTP